MAELNFPANPQVDDEYLFGNLLYKYDGEKWTTWGSGANTALDLRNELATNTGASMIGAASGLTVQEELDMAGVGTSLEPIRRAYAEAGFLVDTSESFALGGTLNAANEALLGPGLVGYSWGGAFPKEVPPNSNPSNSGGIGPGAWINQSNNLLRTQAKAYIDNGMATKVSIAQLTHSGKLSTAAEWADVPAFSDPVVMDQLNAQAQALTARTEVLKSGGGSFSHSGEGAIPRTTMDKMQETISPADFNTSSDMFAALLSRGASTSVINSYAPFTFTVGASGNYATLADALVGVQAMRPFWAVGNQFCELRLKSGYVLDTQMEFGAGVDLSWIKITSEDAVVFTETSSFTKLIRTYYEYKYLFYFYDKAKSPVFAIQMEENRSTSDVCAFVVTQGAELNFYPYSGARKFYVGIHGSFGARIIAHHTGCAADEGSVLAYKPPGYYVCDFSYSKYATLQLVNQVVISMPISKFEYCTESTTASVNCIYDVYADFQGSSASHCYIGWNVRDGSHVNIRDHKTIHCTYRGLTCIHTAYVDARRHDVEEDDAATSGKVLNPAVENGFFGCALGVRIDGAGCVDVAGNDMRNCGTAINADTGAVVSGKAVDISGATIGFDCHGGATIAFPRLWGTDIKKLMRLQDGCRFSANILHAWGAVPTTDIRWVDCIRSEVTINDAHLEADSGIMAESGSRVTVANSTTKIQTFRSFTGSHVAVVTTVADPVYAVAAAERQVTISGGGIASVTSYTNSDLTPLRLSTPRNTIGVGGIIFSVDGEPV